MPSVPKPLAELHTQVERVFCMVLPARQVLSCLRERARSELVGANRPAVITDGLQGTKYVSLSTLASAFGAAGMALTEEETACIVKRFADDRCQRFYLWGRPIRRSPLHDTIILSNCRFSLLV